MDDYVVLQIVDDVIVCYHPKHGLSYISPKKALEAAKSRVLRGVFRQSVVPCLRIQKSLNPNYFPFKSRVYRFEDWQYSEIPVLDSMDKYTVSLVENTLVLQDGEIYSPCVLEFMKKRYAVLSVKFYCFDSVVYLHAQGVKNFQAMQAVYNEVFKITANLSLEEIYRTDDHDFADLASQFCSDAELRTDTFELRQRAQYNKKIVRELQRLELSYVNNHLYLDDLKL